MMRNEILETGQIIILYYNGLWYGDSCGYATLIEKISSSSYDEAWSVAFSSGNETTWGMDDTNKEMNPDEIPF